MMPLHDDAHRGETSATSPSATGSSPMNLADVVAALWPSAAAGPTPASLQQKAREIAISAVCIDSREATPNSLFVALPGERTDGHAYVGAAFAQGAVAALVKSPVPEAATVIDTVRGRRSDRPPERWSPPVAIVVPDTLKALQQVARQRRASRARTGARASRPHPAAHPAPVSDLVVIGVTGSVGKTTAKEAIAAVVAQHALTLKSAGNHNNEIGLPLTLCALRPEHRYAVLEMGMYDLGEIALLCDIAQPNIGVVMNVQPVHLERLGTMERIAQAKAELIDALPPDGLAVLNGDDRRVRAMAARTATGPSPAPTITFGLGETNTVRARDIVGHGLEGIEFVVEVKVEALADSAIAPLGLVGSSVRLHCPTPGRHAVWPALAAVAVGAALGLSWDEIQEGLATQTQESAGLRLAPRPGIGGITVLDDTYNSSPSSALAALDLLADMGTQRRQGRLLAVLGDMLELGSFEREGHRQVGARAADVVEILLTVGPRARYIAEAALEAGMAPEAVHILDDNEAALRLLRTLVHKGDMILIKGSRSMAMEQIVGPLTREE